MLSVVDPAFQSGVPVALGFTVLFIIGVLLHVGCSIADKYLSTYHHAVSVGWEIGLGLAVIGFFCGATVWVALPW